MKMNTPRKSQTFIFNLEKKKKNPNHFYFWSVLALQALSDRLDSKTALLEEPLLPKHPAHQRGRTWTQHSIAAANFWDLVILKPPKHVNI